MNKIYKIICMEIWIRDQMFYLYQLEVYLILIYFQVIFVLFIFYKIDIYIYIK